VRLQIHDHRDGIGSDMVRLQFRFIPAHAHTNQRATGSVQFQSSLATAALISGSGIGTPSSKLNVVATTVPRRRSPGNRQRCDRGHGAGERLEDSFRGRQ
jgi:hypothetical protein